MHYDSGDMAGIAFEDERQLREQEVQASMEDAESVVTVISPRIS